MGAPLAEILVEVDEDLVRYVAQLARLDLTDDEVASMATQLASILHYVEQVQSIAVDETADPATCAPITLDDLRRDEPQATLDVHDIMRGAPASDGAFFVVPHVFDGDDDEGADA